MWHFCIILFSAFLSHLKWVFEEQHQMWHKIQDSARKLNRVTGRRGCNIPDFVNYLKKESSLLVNATKELIGKLHPLQMLYVWVYVGVYNPNHLFAKPTAPLHHK